MISFKKLLVCILVATYPLSLQSDLVFAKGKKSSSKKKTKKKKGKNSLKSASSQVSDGDDYEEETSSVEESPVIESVSTVSASVVSEPVATSTTTTSTATEIDVTKDENWENFRLCMQSNCSGGDDEPNNVQCYKSLTFDSVFQNCKSMVEASKQESFKNYFSGPFLNAEKKAFCEGADSYAGKYNEATGKCAVTVTYTRPAYNGKQFKCGAEKKTLTWYLDGKNYVCSGEVFNVNECYKDSDGYEAAKMKKMMGGITLAMGAVTGTISAFSTKQFADGTEKVKNSDGETVEQTKYRKADWADKTAAFAETGAGQLTSGISDMVTGDIMMKQKGDRLFGSCKLSNGYIFSEGNAIKLTWKDMQ